MKTIGQMQFARHPLKSRIHTKCSITTLDSIVIILQVMNYRSQVRNSLPGASGSIDESGVSH